MPIIGLTDKRASFPQIGVLRKGDVKKDERKPGADLTWFRFDADDQDAQSAFESTYGKEPRAIRVFLPYPTVEENFDAWREEWSASSLKHRCDGEVMVRWLTPRGTYSSDPKPCPYRDLPAHERGCKQVGRLQVIVPELRRLAYVTVLTTSIHDILEINANLLALKETRSDLRGIPMIVRRAPREISTPGADGKRVRREKWLISIEAQPQWVDMQLQSTAQAALPAATSLALPEWDGKEDSNPAFENNIVNSPIAVESSTASSNTVQIRPQSALPDDVGAEPKLNAQLKAYCLKLKKNEKNAQAYFDSVFAVLSFEEKQAKALELGIVTEIRSLGKSHAEIISQISSEEEHRLKLIESIEVLMTDMHALGKSHEEIIGQIARLADGETSIEDMDLPTLKKLDEALTFWRDSARTELNRKAVAK